MKAELRRELELRRKVRKNKERKDVEDSKMGLGANDGGTGSDELDLSQMEGLSLSSASVSSAEVAALSAGDGGAVAAASDGGAEASVSIDICL